MYKRINIFTIVFVLFLLTCPGYSYKLLAQNKPKTAEELTEEKIRNTRSLFMNANKERILGNHEQAAEIYRQVINDEPHHDAAMYELARIYEMNNRQEDAILLMEEAIVLSPYNVWYQLFIADLYKNSGQFKKVIDVFKNLSEMYPEKINYKYDLALSYIITGNYKDALKVYEKIEDFLGVTEEISLQKNIIYLRQNKPEKAIREIEKLVNTFPDNTRFLEILAESYMSNGKENEALETYKKIVEIDPENPYIHISLSDFYRKNGDDDKAFEELKLGFVNSKLDLNTKIQILLSYYTLEQFYNEKKEQAFELSKILVEAHPNNPQALSIYGDLLYKNKKLDEAYQTFNKALSIDSSSYAVWEQVMLLENELRKIKQLEKTSSRAIELFPMQPLPYLFNGIANFQLDNFDETIKVIQNGAKLVIDNDLLLSQFYTYLGDTYNKIKDYEASDDAYEKSLYLNPDDAYVLNNYSYYLSLRNTNLEKAKEMAFRANQIEENNPSFQDTYGWVLYKLGNYEDAKKWIKKALDNEDTENAVILEHYGDVLYKLGRKDKAVKYWIKAKETGGEVSEFLDKKIADKKLYE